jgi:predicted ATPase
LRLLALTVLAQLPGLGGVYLVDEPETGLHPSAVDTVVDALSRAKGPQVLVASHSPVVLGLADPNDVLCFARTAEGTTDVVRGTVHPRLAVWRDALARDALLATGVLG